jgi:hypothetical protein
MELIRLLKLRTELGAKWLAADEDTKHKITSLQVVNMQQLHKYITSMVYIP